MAEALNTGVGNVRNVSRYLFSKGAICRLPDVLAFRREQGSNRVIFLLDEFFKENSKPVRQLPFEAKDQLIYVSTKEEPTTDGIDALVKQLRDDGVEDVCAVVGIGGGVTLDTAKAVSNLITNGGFAADYQGWDLVRVPGVFKIGIPTLSGTGAEATRTCVMTNKDTDLKLGMNSDHTVFDQLILDPDLTATVPRDQYFFTGMDAWIHCVEALNGSYRNSIGDAFSNQAIALCRSVFNGEDMMSDESRGKLMVASYLGGCAIATSYVGVVHPFSAGLSVVLDLHHCVANCIVMMVMEPYYPKEYEEFRTFINRNKIEIPTNVCQGLSDTQFDELYRATIVHEKPLTNALGPEFRLELTERRVRELFEKM